jgi:hypothetical protein
MTGLTMSDTEYGIRIHGDGMIVGVGVEGGIPPRVLLVGETERWLNVMLMHSCKAQAQGLRQAGGSCPTEYSVGHHWQRLGVDRTPNGQKDDP